MRFFLVSFLVLVADQISKKWIAWQLEPGDTISVIPKFFSLTYVTNPGGAFGILPYRSDVFIFLSITVIFLMIFLSFLSKSKQRLAWGLAFLTGGIMGNLIDRLRTGYVIDFLDFRIWPVFNLADVFIFGGALFIIITMLNPRRVKKRG